MARRRRPSFDGAAGKPSSSPAIPRLTDDSGRTTRRISAATILLGLVVGAACGSTFSTSDDGGTNTGGFTSSGGSAGNSGTGGDDGGTGGASTTCATHSGCLVVLDTSDPCFNPNCSAPQGATVQQVAADPCLVLWENRHDPIPEGCAPDGPAICPEICIQAPVCVRARCIGEGCTLEAGYSPEECEPPDAAECEALAEALNEAVQLARECSLSDGPIPVPPVEETPKPTGCTADANVQDACNCPIVVNADATEAVEAAQTAYDAWNEAECLPGDGCGPCPRGTEGACIIGIVEPGMCEPVGE